LTQVGLKENSLSKISSTKVDQGGVTSVTKANIANKRLVLCACLNGDVLLCSVDVNSGFDRLSGSQGSPVYSVDCSATDKSVVYASTDGKINQFYPDKDGGFDHIRSIIAHTKTINCEMES